MKLKYTDNFSCRPVHEHNFMIIIFGCAKNLVFRKTFIDCKNIIGGGTSHFEGKCGNEIGVLRSSN